MIFAHVDGIQYAVRVQHGHVEVAVGRDQFQHIPVETVVEIAPVDAPELAVIGESHLHWSDNPNKAVGRKLALTRALKKMFPDNKNARKIVWEAVIQSGMNIYVPIPR